MRGATGVTIQPHQMLRLPRKMTRQNFKENVEKHVKRHFQCGDDPRPIRPWSDHENANRNPPRHRGYFSSSPRAFSTEKYNVARPILHSNLHQILRLPRKVTLPLHEVLRLPRQVTLELHQVLHLPRKVTLELHQILRLTRKMTPMLDPRYIWNLISNARSNRCHYPTSPNTAPATQNDHLTCGRNLRKTSETSFPMRGRSETDPTMIRPWKRKPQPASPRRLLFELTTSIFYWTIQRFAPNLTFKHSPSAAPATKSDTTTSRNTAPATKSDTWTSPSIAPATKSDTWTSPNTAPDTKNDSYAWSSLHMKPHFQCAEQQVSLSNLTKYCACHAKWPLNVWQKFAEKKWNVISNAGTIRDRSDHDPTMIRPWKRKPQPASPRRLLFELTTSIFYWKIQRFAPNLTFTHSPSAAPATKSDIWTSPSTAPATKSDSRTSPSTAPATKSDSRTSPSTAPVTKSDTWTSPSPDSTLLDSTTLFDSTLLDSTLLDFTLLTWLYSTWLYFTWLYSTWLYSTWLYLLDSTLLDFTLLTWLYSTWLYSIWHYSNWLNLTLLCLTLLYLTLLYLTLLYLTLL